MVSRSRGGPRIDHHLAGVGPLLDELFVTTHPRRHIRGLGHTGRLDAPTVDAGDFWAITRPADARGRERCRPRVLALVFGLVRTVAIPTQESTPMSTQALMRILIIVGVCLVLLIVVNVAR